MKQNSIFEKVSGHKPDPQVITAAVKVLKAGGLLAFPTTGLYGLGADALDPRAVERVFRIKQRDLDKPILVLIKDVSELKRIATPGAPIRVEADGGILAGRIDRHSGGSVIHCRMR